ncbi:HTH-type transcriptional regulator PuuR [Anaerotignum neopropionicum]|uniref:HTH-type transcriptional regulator PuuR n=1 Tax=Anaerotignum neopropionicum TaxID=36847 RepID=A0A136WD68_9FIRM|nr:XRE family transcriptional regulator [Anaerotignum neopropionicum]KXL52426.1 HTH-type transcriptional regulator PuuR [Anaerotignum neopropionicum]
MYSMPPNIGKEMRRIRTEMRISLDTAARLTGVSKAMLGQIERGESIPTISTLWKISTGYKVTFSNFISQPSMENHVLNIGEIYPIKEENGDMLLYNFFPFDPISGLDFLQIHLNPHCRHASFPHTNVLNEYIVVIKGQLEMTIDEKAYLLTEGDAISFKGELNHVYANPSNEETIFHNVIKYK